MLFFPFFASLISPFCYVRPSLREGKKVSSRFFSKQEEYLLPCASRFVIALVLEREPPCAVFRLQRLGSYRRVVEEKVIRGFQQIALRKS